MILQRIRRAWLLGGVLLGLIAAGPVASDEYDQPYLESDGGRGIVVSVPETPTTLDSPGESVDHVPFVPEPEQASVMGDGYRSDVERAWFGAGRGLAARATAARVSALSLGVDNLDVAARALIGARDPGNELTNAMLAVELSPDLPIAHIALARAHWDEGNRGDAISESVSGLLAIFRNFEATTWLVGSLLAMFAVVLILGSLAFIASVGISSLGRVSHDVGDVVSKKMPGFARGALCALLLLVPLALGEGIAGLVLVLFALGMIYGSRRHRMALGLAAILLVLGLHPVSQLAATVLRAPDHDDLGAAALAVVQGIESEAELETLEAEEEDLIAKHVLAIHARRTGDLEEANRRYEALHSSHPREATILTNYANLRYARGESEEAVELYERSAALIDSAQLMFNLSQVYARLFQIERFEAALRAAQELDARTVADLSKIGDANFVADVPFPISSLRSRLLGSARRAAPPDDAPRLLLPGLLGTSWLHTAGAFALVAILSVVFARRFDQASACIRCGKRICARCDGSVWNSETCDGCHHLFHRPETTDPVMRMARLSELQKRESLRSKVAAVVSLLIPGAGGLLARRPDLGFIGILFFAAAVVLLGWSEGVVPDPLVVGSVGTMAFVIAGSMAILGYLVVVAAGLLIRRSL